MEGSCDSGGVKVLRLRRTGQANAGRVVMSALGKRANDGL